MLPLKKLPPEPDSTGTAAEGRHVEHLRQVVLFTDIKAEPGAVESISRVMETRRYEPATSIITEGEAGSELFILLQGQVSIYKSTTEGDHYKVAVLSGEQRIFFGEGGLLDNDPRSATIKADTVCECLVLSRPAFEAFCKDHPQWALPVLARIARAVMARLRKTNNDLMLLYNALVAEIRGR